MWWEGERLLLMSHDYSHGSRYYYWVDSVASAERHRNAGRTKSEAGRASSFNGRKL